MASQSLYRKWRSQTFSDLIGQEAITRTLLNAVREGRLSHAYLFCGPRGTGKTSAARLLAKAINCANPQNGEPCNECVSCREVIAGTSPDVIEIDAASNNGVDHIRDLRANAGLLAGNGHHKVYVIDEVHMLSTSAFNALLKTLEEPPPHVIFVLATTEAHKVLPTVVSRCQRFDFRRHTTRNIIARLNHVAEGEGLELEGAAAELLARVAQGGMRDALSLLDQAMAYCGTHIDLARTREMLGLSDVAMLRAILRAVAEERAAAGLELINSLIVAGADVRQMQQQLAEEWRALMLARSGADVAQMLDCSDEEAREIGALAEAFSLDELMACARVFAHNETPARGLPVPQLSIEIAFLDCVSIRSRRGLPAQPAQSARDDAPRPRTSANASGVAATSHARPAAPSEPLPGAPLRALAPTPQPPVVPIADAPDQPRAQPALHLVPSAPTQEESLAAPERWEAPRADPEGDLAAAAEAPGQGDIATLMNAVRQEWEMIRKVCKQKSPKLYALLNDAAPTRVEPGTPPLLVMHARHEFHYNSLRRPESIQAIEWAIEQVIEHPMRVRIELAGGNDGSGASGHGPRNSPGDGAGGGSSYLRGPGASGSHGPRAGYESGAPAGRALPGSAAATAPQGRSHTSAPTAIREERAPAPLATGARNAPSAPVRADVVPLGAMPAMPTAADVAAQPVPPHADEGTGEPSPQSVAHARLEAEVRDDPLVRELMSVCHVELAEVLPLADEDEEASAP